MEYADKIKSLIEAKHINDVAHSVNANASGTKSIPAIVNSVLSEHKKEIGWEMLGQYLTEVGKFRRAVKEGDIYLHDEEQLGIPYCASFDFTRVLYEETFFGGLHSAPVKRCDSYVAYITNAVSNFSQQIAGAMGISSFFTNLGYLMRINNIRLTGEDDYYLENLMQGFVHSVNHLSRGDQSAFTNISILDETSLNQIPSVSKEDIPYILYIQDIFLKFFLAGNKKQGGLPFSFPVTTLNLSGPSSTLLDGPVKNNPDRVNFNINRDGDKFSMCCRLVLDIAERARLLGNSSASFSNSPMAVGSHRVVTINFNRIALKQLSLMETYGLSYVDPAIYYLELLDELLLEIVVPLLEGHRAMIKDFIDKGVLPLFNHGWMFEKNLFSTVGMIGLIEAERTIDRPGLVGVVLSHLNKMLQNITTASGNMYNLEQIPGEEARFKLAAKDRETFGSEYEVPNFYANQFAPLIEEDNFLQKIKTEGEYYSLLTGGGITHLRLPALPTPEQTKRIVKECCDKGVDHFAISSTYSRCPNNHVSYGYHQTCPECGEQIETVMERPIGYWANVDGWGVNSRTYDFPNRKVLSHDLTYQD